MDSTAVKVVPAPPASVERAGNQALTAIAIFKLAKAALCLAAAIGVFSVLHGDTQAELRKLLHVFRISGDREFVREVLERSANITVPKKKLITALLTFSGLMFTLEGVGLLLRKPWAEYFTVILTSAGIPVELYEVARHVTGLKLAALSTNLIVVAFLIAHLVRARRERQAHSLMAAAVPQSVVGGETSP